MAKKQNRSEFNSSVICIAVLGKRSSEVKYKKTRGSHFKLKIYGRLTVVKNKSFLKTTN